MHQATLPVSVGRDAAQADTWPQVGVRWLPFTVLTGAVAAVFVCELLFGVVHIPFVDAVRVLLHSDSDSPYATILWRVRIPRALMAMAAGAALASSGLLLQTLFRNPLAGPWVLGVTSGAGLGVALIVLAGSAVGARTVDQWGVLGNAGIAGGGFVGAGLTVLVIARAGRRLPPMALLILGLMIQYVADACVGFLLQFTEEEQLRAYGSWHDATFNTATTDQLGILLPGILAGLAFACVLAKPLNGLLLGERYASSLGVRVRQVRSLVLTSVVLLSGVVTAFCGPITFIDLAVPHLCRGLLRTTDHRVLLPAVALMGALITVSGDLLVHLPWQRHLLHLNYITALIGVPVALWVVLRQRSGAAGGFMTA